jgi:Chaperone of endosialidase
LGYTYSSRRWKTNIQPLHNALGMVEQLRGVSYDLKDSGKHEIGVIAEEVGEVVPEVVSFEENGKDARGVDYSRLTALLIEATKEQQREFQQQQAQLAKALRQIKQQQNLLRAQNSAMRSLEAEVCEARETLRKVKAQVAAAQPALVAAK